MAVAPQLVRRDKPRRLSPSARKDQTETGLDPTKTRAARGAT